MPKPKSKIPKEILAGLKKLAEVTKKPSKEIGAELKEIMKTNDACKMMENEEAKIRFAYSILAGRYSTSDGSLCYIVPLATPRYRRVKETKLVGDVSCLSVDFEIDDGTGDEVPGNEVHYCYGSFWDDVAKEIETLERGKVYKCKLVKKEQSFGYKISGNSPNFEEIDYKFPSTPKQFFKEEILPNCEEVQLDSLDISESKDSTDLKIVRGTVTVAKADSNEKGEFAYYDCFDMSTLGKSTERFFVNPEDLIWGQSSVIYVVGTIDKKKDKNEYKFNVQFVVDDHAIKINLVPTVVNEEVADLDLDEDDDEKKKEDGEEEVTEEEEEEDDDDFGI